MFCLFFNLTFKRNNPKSEKLTIWHHCDHHNGITQCYWKVKWIMIFFSFFCMNRTIMKQQCLYIYMMLKLSWADLSDSGRRHMNTPIFFSLLWVVYNHYVHNNFHAERRCVCVSVYLCGFVSFQGVLPRVADGLTYYLCRCQGGNWRQPLPKAPAHHCPVHNNFSREAVTQSVYRPPPSDQITVE